MAINSNCDFIRLTTLFIEENKELPFRHEAFIDYLKMELSPSDMETSEDKLPTLAPRTKRLAAAVVDVFVFLPLIVFIARPLGLIDLSQSQEIQAFDLEKNLKLFLIGQILFLLVQGYLLQTRGQTIGKILLKIRIVGMKSERPGMIKLYLLRYFPFSLIAQIPVVGGLLALINLLFIFGKEQRCLHDRLAGTRVVNAA